MKKSDGRTHSTQYTQCTHSVSHTGRVQRAEKRQKARVVEWSGKEVRLTGCIAGAQNSAQSWCKKDFLHLTWYILQNRWGSLKSFFAQNYYAAEFLSLAKLRHRALQKVGLHFLRASVTGTMLTGRLVSPTWAIRFLEICKAGTLGEFLWIWNLLWIQTEKTVFCDSNFLNFDIKWHGAKIIIVYILNLVNIMTKENIFVNIIRNANICFVI